MGQVISAVKNESGLYNIEVDRPGQDSITKMNDMYRYTVPPKFVNLVMKDGKEVNLFDKNIPINQLTLAKGLMQFLPNQHAGLEYDSPSKEPKYDPSKPFYVYISSEGLNETGTKERPNVLTRIYALETNDMTMSVPPKNYPFAIDPCPPGIVCKVPQSLPADNFYMILIGVILVILVIMMLWR
jgi:hypothetical protein